MEGTGKFEASSPPCLETVSSAKNWREKKKLNRKHCQRHNGPRALSLKLELTLKLKSVQIQFSPKDNSSYIDSIPWVCCASGNVYISISLYRQMDSRMTDILNLYFLCGLYINRLY